MISAEETLKLIEHDAEVRMFSQDDRTLLAAHLKKWELLLVALTLFPL